MDMILSILVICCFLCMSKSDRFKDINQDCSENLAVHKLCDPDALLESSEFDEISKELQLSSCNCEECPRDRTECLNLYVVVVNHMLRHDHHKKNKSAQLIHAKQLATKLYNELPEAKCEIGALLFYPVQDKVFYTITGKLTKEKLTDDLVGDISMTNSHKIFSGPASGLLSVIKDFRSAYYGTYREIIHIEKPNHLPRFLPLVYSKSTEILKNLWLISALLFSNSVFSYFF